MPTPERATEGLPALMFDNTSSGVPPGAASYDCCAGGSVGAAFVEKTEENEAKATVLLTVALRGARKGMTQVHLAAAGDIGSGSGLLSDP